MCSHLPSIMSFWSYCHVIPPRDKIKTYLHFHKNYNIKLCNSHLGWRTPTHKAIWLLITWAHKVTQKITNIISCLPQNLLPTNYFVCFILFSHFAVFELALWKFDVKNPKSFKDKINTFDTSLTADSRY